MGQEMALVRTGHNERLSRSLQHKAGRYCDISRIVFLNDTVYHSFFNNYNVYQTSNNLIKLWAIYILYDSTWMMCQNKW